ncbi:MAG: hypothetical protein DRR16_29040 [Candidatus Parabeggiatoa sp. nov. 3]|jgi:hypothetical protein|nr:MAG: hypothetical protein DRR00_20410 [Gammaproteobacteria bacterium]RKZ63185.1 MAG: hypothetical protein DRQ99_17505 [Gammaproteobacteria bacterium]RKZ77767.1 MAG: hypothetical protein DRR16_29040 [Gammaproteobacteria bacterium]
MIDTDFKSVFYAIFLRAKTEMNILTSSNITEHIFQDHLVLLNHATNQLLVLNPSARLVWQW